MSGPRSQDEGFADTVDTVMAHLEKVPILLEELMGNGHTATPAPGRLPWTTTRQPVAPCATTDRTFSTWSVPSCWPTTAGPH